MGHQIFSTANVIYWLFIITAITLTTTTLGRLWKRRENLRWTTGYVVVFLSGSILVWLGYWDAGTWAGLFFAVGLAGIIKVGYEAYCGAREAERIRRGENEQPAA